MCNYSPVSAYEMESVNISMFLEIFSAELVAVLPSAIWNSFFLGFEISVSAILAALCVCCVVVREVLRAVGNRLRSLSL